MKSTYETPRIDLIMLYNADIITTSGGTDNDIGEDHGKNDGEWI